jgi:hypothetical protein
MTPSKSSRLAAAQWPLLVLALVALAMFAACEVLLCFPVAWWLYGAVGVLFAAGLLRRRPAREQKARLALLGAAWACAALLCFVPWSSRKPFLRDLGRIKAGMTENEVRNRMARYKEGTGWPAMVTTNSDGASVLRDASSGLAHPAGVSPSGQLTLRDALVFRHSDDGQFNSDWGIVSFTNGRVAQVGFSPD